MSCIYLGGSWVNSWTLGRPSLAIGMGCDSTLNFQRLFFKEVNALITLTDLIGWLVKLIALNDRIVWTIMCDTRLKILSTSVQDDSRTHVRSYQDILEFHFLIYYFYMIIEYSAQGQWRDTETFFWWLLLDLSRVLGVVVNTFRLMSLRIYSPWSKDFREMIIFWNQAFSISRENSLEFIITFEWNS